MPPVFIEEAVELALAQVGDKYVYGAESVGTDPDPEAFDCSELFDWVAQRLDVEFVDQSMNQRAFCQRAGTMISVERARTVRGALVFRDTSVTGTGHVAMSLGNGRTVEARGSAFGVGRFPFDNRGWTEAARFPGFDYSGRGEPRLEEFWVCLGRFGGRWGRAERLGDLHEPIVKAEARHDVALVLRRKEPVQLQDIGENAYPEWLARKQRPND